MKCLIVCVAASIISISALRVVEQDTNPITRVVGLLETLLNDLKVDGKAEEKMYLKYACWCKDNLEHYAHMIQVTLPKELREQTGLVQEADMHIGIAIRVIEESTKLIEDKTNDNENLNNALNKEYTRLQKDNAENYESMAALRDAIAIFSEKAAEEGGSLLQMGASTMNVFRKAMMQLPDTIQIPEKDVALLSEFSKTGSLYAPQHGPILGMMKSMFMNLAQDIEKADAVFMQSAKTTETFVYNNNLGIAKAKAAIARHTKKKLEMEEQKNAAEEEIGALLAELEHSKKFFRRADTDCRATRDDWTVRQNLRDTETKGVKMALKILKKQRALFDRSIQAGLKNERDNLDFLQIAQSSSLRLRLSKAVDTLSSAARRSGSLDLAQVAMSLSQNPGTDGATIDVNTAVFDDVMKTIDSLIAELKQQDRDDIKERDDCIKDLHVNSEKQKQLKWDIQKKVEHYAALNHTRQELLDKTAALEAELDATIAENNRLTEARNESSIAIWNSIEDDQNALIALRNATDFLSSYYKDNAALLQEAERAEPVFVKDNERAPENDFSGKMKRGNQAKTILALMKHIEEDMENEIQTSKEQDAYEQFEFNKQQDLLDGQADNLHAQLVIVDTLESENDADIITVEQDLERMGGDFPYDGGDVAATSTNELKDLMIEHNMIAHEDSTQTARNEDDGVGAGQRRGCERALAIFEKARDKRKIEVEALTSAKALLAGDLSQTQ